MAVTVQSRLSEIADQIPDRVDNAAGRGAHLIAEGARARVAVGPHAPHLRDDIHVVRLGRGIYAVVAGKRDTFYGHMVEFGTSHSAPQPFLVPASEAHYTEVVRGISAALKGL